MKNEAEVMVAYLAYIRAKLSTIHSLSEWYEHETGSKLEVDDVMFANVVQSVKRNIPDVVGGTDQ